MTKRPVVSSLVEFSGRLLLAGLFVLAGLSKLAAPGATAQFMATGGLPDWPTLAVLVGLFEVIAGLALAAGLQVRWSAFALAAFTLVASTLFHAYWAAPAEQQFIQQLLFTKNLGVVGGLLAIGAADAARWKLNAIWAKRAAQAG